MVDSGMIKWESPSNIAIVKYWGKYGRQMPRNTSVSFTLSEAKTITSFFWEPKENDNPSLDISFLFEGQEKPGFAQKSIQFLNQVADDFTWLKHHKIKIDTTNTFPHSAGIASSASGMSALAACLVDAHLSITGENTDEDAFLKKVSSYARIGSGSAARSLFKSAAIWGKNERIPYASDEYAVGIENYLHPIFLDFHDDIIIVSNKEKSVSSSAGHGLMEGNPYAPARYAQAQNHSFDLMDYLENGDLKRFGEILELEAMTLHALMMASTPSFILMAPESLHLIAKIRSFRNDTGLPVYFTLDAGPNIHLLYPDDCKTEVDLFLKDTLSADVKVIKDRVGQGAQKLL
ncbi:MAG TPA: diphosphomevalonate decarboxylase [Saprospiraceae bacterium]|nr:diphosphomevalonate decarboxylase [Saprospiraceae bacterium]HPN69813.1 diphosphomevalonate decarboxylase [Saprospiraceae bacterium]